MSFTDPEQLGLTGTDLYRATLPAAYAESDTGQAWARYLGGLSLLLDPVARICRSFDGQPRWTQLASPTRCPPEWLRVLAQWAGIRRADAMTDQQLRDLIGPHAPGMWRGTRAAMIAAVRRFMPTDWPLDNLIYFEERADLGYGDNAYHLRVFTYSFVDHDPDQVRAALEAAKPAGLILDYEVRVGQAWFMVNLRRTSWADVNVSYLNWDGVHRDQPLELPTPMIPPDPGAPPPEV